MFILQPPKSLRISNSCCTFPKYDQILNCERLYISNSRIHMGPHNGQLFINVTKCKLNNSIFKHNVFASFSKLERL